MTSSSSPGIALKQEGLSYIAGSDVPAFVVNVQRGGPGLGGIQPSQSDYFQATKGGGHGDYKTIVLAPASVQEMASLTIKGFNLADKYRMTAMILADGTIGQMMEPISFEDAEIEKYDKPWALTGTGCVRKHNVVNSLYLKPEELEIKNFQRYERYKLVEENETMWEEYMMEDAEVCVVAFGIASRVAKNAIDAFLPGGNNGVLCHTGGNTEGNHADLCVLHHVLFPHGLVFLYHLIPLVPLAVLDLQLVGL